MDIGIFEDNAVIDSYPLTYTRPFYELRCGLFSLLERYRRVLRDEQFSLFCRDYLQNVVKENYPETVVNKFPDTPMLFLNGRVLLNHSFEFPQVTDKPVCYKKDDTIVAAFLPEEQIHIVKETAEHGILSFDSIGFSEVISVDWTLMRYPWDFIRQNANQIEKDLNLGNSGIKPDTKQHKGVFLEKPESIYLDREVQLKPGVALDGNEGPVVIGEGANIGHNSVIIGPCAIGNNSKISPGTKLTGNCTFGPVSNVGGEVGDTIIQGYSNKKHDGFLGGAYLGEWVNVGAGTNNSDLKNNYSMVSVPIHGQPINTGLQFLGCIIGDHTKIGIGTTINTGTVLGAGCNIFGSGFPAKFVPSFTWGGEAKLVEHQLEKMLKTAGIVASRRQRELTEIQLNVLRYVFELTENLRQQYL